MSCLKCGRDTEEGQVFCASCRNDMLAYPVRPGTTINLPKNREDSTAKKKLKSKATREKRTMTPQAMEERMKSLQRATRTLSALLVLLVLLCAVMAYPTWQFFASKRHKLGQNYSTVTTTAVENGSDVSRETKPAGSQ